MLQVNANANLNNGMSIATGMAISFTPYLEQARPNDSGTGVVVPLGLSCFLNVATANSKEFKALVPIKDGAESVDERSLYTQNIEFTNAEWASPTGVNRDTMETELIAVLEDWNTDWVGNIVKV